MKKNIFSAIMAMLMLVTSMVFVACDGEDQLNTDPFDQPVSLLAFGPSPVARGGELRIIGTGLDKVTSVTLPGCGEISSINHISSEEIRVTVPQDAQPGKIAIRTSSESYESVTVISYTEPVGFAENGSLTPNPVKPGQVLTIKGEYLNLVQAVIFAEGVEVPVENPSRPEISVVVPAEAQSGKIAISFCATGDTIPNQIFSTEVLNVVLPAVNATANLTGKKPGDEIKQAGSNLDLVEKLTVAGQEVAFSISGDNITYKLPAETPAEATVTMYPASGVGVVIATIGMQLPSALKADPAKNVWAGSKITISGKDLDVVTSAVFPGVANAVAVSDQSATSLTVTVPEGAQSGDLVLNCKSGVSVSVAIETLKPAFEAYSANPVAANGELEIKGANLNTVNKVQFEGVDPVEVTASAGSIKVNVPTMATTGVVKMLMSNGESVDFPELKVNSPECAFIVDPSLLLTTDENPMHAGDLIPFVIENADKFTGVKVDGAECQTIIKDNVVYVLTPDNAGLKSVLTLVSSNGTIDYPLALLPNSEIVTTLWSGASTLSWSGEGQIYLGNDGGEDLIAAEAKAGDILRIKLVPTADDWQVQVWEGHWGTQYDEIKASNYDLAGNGGYYNITLTDELLATFTNKQWWGGIVLVQGQSCIVTALELLQVISLETDIKDFTLYEDRSANISYPFMPSWSDGSGKARIMRPGLADLKLKAGKSKMIVYKTESSTGQLQINDANWSSLATAADWSGNTTSIEVEFTDAMIKCVTGETADTWSETAFILQGDGLTITKITILP